MRNIFVILLAISSSCLFACGNYFWNEAFAPDVKQTVAVAIAAKTKNNEKDADQEDIFASSPVKNSFLMAYEVIKEKERLYGTIKEKEKK